MNKNGPNDARSVAVTALRSRTVREVVPDDHCAVLRMWSRRQHDLGRNRTRIACRLHAALCELVTGGIGEEITVAAAAAMLEQVTPCGAVQQARRELAADLLEDLRRADDQMREAKRKLAAAVQATGTSLTEVFGVGPVIAATVTGEAGDASRFASRDAFAPYNGTAPIEVSSGKRKVYRLSLRGNRRLNHAAHMTAVTQVRYPHSQGRVYYDKKIAEGKTAKEALRALKRQVSDAFYRCLKADAARAAAVGNSREGNGERLCRQGGRLSPRMPALRPGHSRTTAHPTTPAQATEERHVTASREDQLHHLTQRGVDLRARRSSDADRHGHTETGDLRGRSASALRTARWCRG